MSRTRLLLPAILLLGAAWGAVHMASITGVPGDFRRYHRAGRLVATGLADRLYDDVYLEGRHVYAQERAADLARRGADADPYPEREFKYLPATAVLLAPLGALPLRTAKVWWGAWNGFLVALLFVACARFASGGLRGAWTLVAVVLLGNLANANLMLGQLNPSAVVPATLGLYLLSRRRDATAGVLVAFGAVVKFMPALLALWFAWKRRPRALVALVLGVAVVGWGLPAAVVGPRLATDLTVEYFGRRSATYVAAVAPEVPGLSVKSFLYRTIAATRGRVDTDEPSISVARLPEALVYALVLAVDLALLAFAARVTRGPLAAPGDRRGALEASAVLCALLLVSPESRAPHFLYLALPVTALVYAFVATRDEGRRWPPAARAALGTAFVGALLLQTSPPTFVGRAANRLLAALCSLGWAAACFLAAVALMLSVLRRRDRERAPRDSCARTGDPTRTGDTLPTGPS